MYSRCEWKKCKHLARKEGIYCKPHRNRSVSNLFKDTYAKTLRLLMEQETPLLKRMIK